MQDGPRYLTDADINTVTVYTPLTPGSSQGAWTPGSSVDPLQFGQVGQTGDGRFYRLALIGGTSTIAAGSLLVAPTAATNSTGLAIPATQPSNTATGNGASGSSALAKGSLSFNVTNGVTTVTADEFIGGYVDVLQTSGTSEGPVSYKLAGNTGATSGGVITLRLAEPLAQPEALVAATDTVNLRKNPYYNVITSSTAAQPVGITPVQVPNTSTAQYLAWLQTKGHCMGQEDSTASVAFQNLAQSTTTAGDVTAVGAFTTYVIGQALTTATSNPVVTFLNLP
jgi:hypothetical protein